MLSFVMLSVIYTECRYGECCYADCRYADCHYTEFRKLAWYAECHYDEFRYAECHGAINMGYQYQSSHGLIFINIVACTIKKFTAVIYGFL